MTIRVPSAATFNCLVRIDGHLIWCTTTGEERDGAVAVYIWKADAAPIAYKVTLENMGVRFEDIHFLVVNVPKSEIVKPLNVDAVYSRYHLSRVTYEKRPLPQIIYSDDDLLWRKP